MAALTAIVLFALLSAAGSARADITGQLDAWGEFGEEPGKLLDPSFMGVDTADGSVFVGSYTFAFDETRIQKFSEAGEFEGAVSLPGFEGYVGIAVDAANHRFYVLQSAKTGAEWTASKVLAFNSTPDASKVLQPAAVPNLPVPTGSGALVAPQQLLVDPSSGGVVILAENSSRKTVLQRIDVAAGGAGTVGPAFVDTGGAIGPQHAIAIDSLGVTYVLGADNDGSKLVASTLPAGFTASSKLTAVPGFTTAVGPQPGNLYVSPASSTEGVNYGPQLAVTTAANGDRTLFWKTGGASASGDRAEIHGYSVGGETYSTFYGNGSSEGSCKFTAPRSALTSGRGENLVVLDQGQEVFAEADTPSSFPIVSRFGPGGSKCPAPAAAFAVESGGQPVTTVTAGSGVTLNGSASELKGATLEGVTWKVTGPETFTETGTSLTSVPAGRFAVQGTYSIRLIFRANAHLSQSTFAAPAQTLVVTPGSGTPQFALNFTRSGTGSGSFECSVDGGAAGACLGAYPQGSSVTVTPKPAAGSKFVNWTGDCSGAGACTVTMSSSHSVGAAFDLGSASTELALTVSAPANGSIGCDSGTGVGRCATKYPAGTVVNLTATPAPGFEFAGWSGDCTGVGTAICTLTMNSAHSVGAVFRALAASPGPGSSAPPAGGGSSGGGSSGGGAPPPPGNKGGTPKPIEKTPAQKLREKRLKAIAKCKKLKGKPKSQCLKKANLIGKPKPKKAKHKGK